MSRSTTIPVVDYSTPRPIRDTISPRQVALLCLLTALLAVAAWVTQNPAWPVGFAAIIATVLALHLFEKRGRAAHAASIRRRSVIGLAVTFGGDLDGETTARIVHQLHTGVIAEDTVITTARGAEFLVQPHHPNRNTATVTQQTAPLVDETQPLANVVVTMPPRPPAPVGARDIAMLVVAAITLSSLWVIGALGFTVSSFATAVAVSVIGAAIIARSQRRADREQRRAFAASLATATDAIPGIVHWADARAFIEQLNTVSPHFYTEVPTGLALTAEPLGNNKYRVRIIERERTAHHS